MSEKWSVAQVAKWVGRVDSKAANAFRKQKVTGETLQATLKNAKLFKKLCPKAPSRKKLIAAFTKENPGAAGKKGTPRSKPGASRGRGRSWGRERGRGRGRGTPSRSGYMADELMKSKKESADNPPVNKSGQNEMIATLEEKIKQLEEVIREKDIQISQLQDNKTGGSEDEQQGDDTGEVDDKPQVVRLASIDEGQRSEDQRSSSISSRSHKFSPELNEQFQIEAGIIAKMAGIKSKLKKQVVTQIVDDIEKEDANKDDISAIHIVTTLRRKYLRADDAFLQQAPTLRPEVLRQLTEAYTKVSQQLAPKYTASDFLAILDAVDANIDALQKRAELCKEVWVVGSNGGRHDGKYSYGKMRKGNPVYEHVDAEAEISYSKSQRRWCMTVGKSIFCKSDPTDGDLVSAAWPRGFKVTKRRLNTAADSFPSLTGDGVIERQRAQTAPAPQDWKQYTNKNGRNYYYSKVERKSTWTDRREPAMDET